MVHSGFMPHPGPAEPQRRARFFSYALVGTAVVVLGALLRLRGIDRSLWLDEAWVGNSALADSLRDMLFGGRWLQPSPPLFLLAVRGGLVLAGHANWAFRLVPWLAGVAAVVLFARLTRRHVGSAVALLAVALVAFSPSAIDYARELKQYAVELLCGTVLLSLSFAALGGCRMRLRWLVPTVVTCLGLGYGSLFFVPGLLLATAGAWRAIAPDDRAPRRRDALILASVVLVALAVLSFQVRANTSPMLHDFWFGDARRGGAQADSVALYAAVLLLALPGGDRLARLPGGAIAGVAGILVVVVAGLWVARRASRERWRQLVSTELLCVLPVAGALVASLVRQYPWQLGLCQALLPALLLGLVAALAELVRPAPSWGLGPADAIPPSRNRRRWLGDLLAGAAIVALLAGLALGVRDDFAPVRPVEDAESAVRFLRTAAQSGDLIYVHSSMEESFRLYSQLQGWEPTGVLDGQSGWPCCPRSLRQGESAAEIVAHHDLVSQLPSGFRGRVWVTYTSRADHWQYLGVNEPRLMHDDMLARGCRQADEGHAIGVAIVLFVCGA